MGLVGGIVLAGGRSSRMGTAKANLDWHGVPLVVHVVNAVAAVVDGPVIVVAAPDQALPPGLTVVRDPVEGRGPLQGLAAGLAALEADAAFVCATDQPFASQAARPLIDALSGHDAAVQALNQPLGAVYRTALAATAQQRLAIDGRLKGLLTAIDTIVVPGDESFLRSLDTPEAYADALTS